MATLFYVLRGKGGSCRPRAAFGRKAPAALGDSLLGLVAVFPCSGVLGFLHGNAKSIMFIILYVSLEVPLSVYHCMCLCLSIIACLYHSDLYVNLSSS